MTAPKRYRKKPEPDVEALQFDGSPESFTVVTEFVGGLNAEGHSWNPDTRTGGLLDTRTGTCCFVPGHWIIRGADGKFDLCTPDSFQATYEEVADGDQVELTGENALTVEELEAIAVELGAMRSWESSFELGQPLWQTYKAACAKLAAALTQHTTSEGGSDE